MKKFNIYHAINPTFEAIEDQPRRMAGSVWAESLEKAFKASQNFENHWNTAEPCRSTSVGDVIEAEEGFYMVCGAGYGTGFHLLDKMSKNDSDLSCLENQSPEC